MYVCSTANINVIEAYVLILTYYFVCMYLCMYSIYVRKYMYVCVYVCIMHKANVRNLPDVVGDPHRTMSIDLALRVNKGLAADKNGHFANMASYQVPHYCIHTYILTEKYTTYIFVFT